jgi:hypothetical protein
VKLLAIDFTLKVNSRAYSIILVRIISYQNPFLYIYTAFPKAEQRVFGPPFSKGG